MKRIVASVLTFVLCMSVVVSNRLDVKAAEGTECIEGSYLLEEDSSEGTAIPTTKGVYLKSGSSAISKIGTNKIGAGGDTVGQKVVSKIAVTVEVQWLVDGSWKTLTTWSATKTNAAMVSTSKTLTVPSGHFYRVYCRHYAGSDSSDSFTNGIFI